MSEELTRNVIDYVEQHPGSTAIAAARGLKVKLIPVVNVLKALADEGLIRRQMSKRYHRHWVVEGEPVGRTISITNEEGYTSFGVLQGEIKWPPKE